MISEKETAKKLPEIAEKSEKAKIADELVKKLPDDVQVALEAMERTTRVRRMFVPASRQIKYAQVC